MRWLWVLILFFTTSVFAQTPGITPPFPQGQCPYGNAVADGCSGAPAAGMFQRKNFFTYARQSLQTYVTRPPWNVAGVDYGVGPPSTTAFRSPAVAMPSGCVLTGGQYYLCTGTNFTIENIDFTKLSGCTALRINASGNVVIRNVILRFNTNCVGLGNMLSTVLATTSNLSITNSIIDGNCAAFPAGPDVLISHVGSSGTFTSRYNAYLNGAGSFTQTNAAANRIEEYNYGEGMVCRNAGIHASWASTQTPSGTIPTWSFNFNTAMSLAVPFGNTGITAFAEVGDNGTATLTTVNVRNNVMVANKTFNTAGATMSYPSTIQDVTVTTANYYDNFVDPTGALGCFSLVAAPVIGTLNQARNVNLRDGSLTGFSLPCNGHF